MHKAVENYSGNSIVEAINNIDLTPGSENINLTVNCQDDEHETKCFVLETELAEWGIKHNATNDAMNALLKILRKYHPSLPKDYRTVKKTPKKIELTPLGAASYLHFGLKHKLQLLLQKYKNFNEDQIIDIGIDGLPLSKSSNSQLWPILGNVVGLEDVFLIGAYHGYTKPSCANTFLREFVKETIDLQTHGIQIDEVVYNVKIRAFVCDAPAKSFILQVKGHSGYYGCSKYEIKGNYIDRWVVYSEIDKPLRTDVSFRNRQQVNYHKEFNEIELEKINIGCVYHNFLWTSCTACFWV